jgi:uncharacterized protein (DUF1501 family)
MQDDQLSTRRIFLQNGLAILAAATTVPAFLDRTAWAIDNPADGKGTRTQKQTGKDGKILVVVQLSGGNDGLSSVIPTGDDAYYRARPGIGIAKNDALKVNDYLSLHPNLAPLKKLYDDGNLSIIQGVGYPNPNRSHFRSMDIWQTADPVDEMASVGWVGKYFDNTCTGADPHVGVAFGENLPLAMKGQRVTPLAFDRAESYQYKGRDKDSYLKLNEYDGTDPAMANDPAHQKPKAPSQQQVIRPKKKQVEVASSTDQLDFLRRTAMDAQVSSDRLLTITRNFRPEGNYPNNGFGNGLRTVAAMIGGGMPTRVYYVTLGGFDTHAGQRGRHDQLMQQFAQGVEAFRTDMLKQENGDRVLMMTFSEFGRRVQQNASGGTDHGAAAPMFVIGPRLKTGVIGKHPSLTDLDQGDLKHNIDFRGVYATVLQDWLETPSKPILGQQFKTFQMFKA